MSFIKKSKLKQINLVHNNDDMTNSASVNVNEFASFSPLTNHKKSILCLSPSNNINSNNNNKLKPKNKKISKKRMK